MYGNCIVGADSFFIPDLLINLVNRKYLACIFYQKQENIVFNRSQLNGSAVNRYFLIVIINLKAATAIQLSKTLLGNIAQLGIAAELGFNAANKLQRNECISQVVVSSDIQSQNIVCVFGFG